MSDTSQFQTLLQCYLSDQMTEKQWQDHLKYDVGLKEWYDNYRQEKKTILEDKFDKLKQTGMV